MAILLAVLLSGVLLDHKDQPMPIYHLTIIAADGKLAEAITTDKDGKFSVDLAPGAYRVLIGFDGTGESITVDKKTSTLKLHRRAPEPHAPNVIETIDGTKRGDFVLPLGPRA